MSIFMVHVIAASIFTAAYLGVAHLVFVTMGIPHAATVGALGISTWLLSGK